MDDTVYQKLMAVKRVTSQPWKLGDHKELAWQTLSNWEERLRLIDALQKIPPGEVQEASLALLYVGFGPDQPKNAKKDGAEISVDPDELQLYQRLGLTLKQCELVDNQPIDVLELPRFIRMPLRRNGCDTLLVLLGLTKSQLVLYFSNRGDEIVEVVILKLQEYVDEYFSQEPSIDTPLEMKTLVDSPMRFGRWLRLNSLFEAAVRDMPISKLKLNTQTRNFIVRKYGELTVGQLLDKSMSDVLAIPNFGEVRLKEVSRAIKNALRIPVNLRLPDPKPEPV